MLSVISSYAKRLILAKFFLQNVYATSLLCNPTFENFLTCVANFRKDIANRTDKNAKQNNSNNGVRNYQGPTKRRSGSNCVLENKVWKCKTISEANDADSAISKIYT